MMFYLLPVYLKLIYFVVPVALAVINNDVSTTDFAYFDLYSEEFTRCNDGLMPAVAKAFEIDSIDKILSLFSQNIVDTIATTTNNLNGVRPSSNIGSSEGKNNLPATTRTRRSAEFNQYIKTDENNMNSKKDSKNKVLSIEEIGIRAGGAGITRNIISFIQLLTKLKPKNYNKSLNTRSLQTENSQLELLKDFQPVAMRALSPTFLHLLTSLFDSFRNLKIEQKDINVAEALCLASSYSNEFDTDPSAYVCTLEKFIFALAQCRDPVLPNCNSRVGNVYLPEKCYTDSKVSKFNETDMKSYSSHFFFDDIRQNDSPMLPVNLTQDRYETEGFYYFLLFRAINVASSYTHQVSNCGYTDDSYVTYIPGFRVIHRIMYNMLSPIKDAEVKQQTVPFIVVLESVKEEKRCQYIFVIRGTSNDQEWVFDFSFKLVDFLVPNAKIHQGYGMLTYFALTEILSMFRLHNIFAKCDNIEFIVTGHSLGGSITRSLGLALGYTFPQIRVTAVSFAGLNIFDEEGENLYRKYVNGRNIKVDMDMIAELFCTTDQYKYGTYYCDNNPYNPNNWMKYVRTSAVYNIKYANVNKDMEGLTNAWIGNVLTPTEITVPSNLQLHALHLCSYSCALSKFCQPRMKANPSELWNCKKCSGIFSLQK